jgi:4-alpha-glucanotransferase
MIPVEDLLGVEDGPNLPGTTDQHPNWRRRLPGIAGAMLDAPQVQARIDILNQTRQPPEPQE